MTNTASNKVTKAEALKVINKASSELAYALDNIKWSKLYTDYLKENIAEEKSHDRFRGDSISRGLTITEAGKLFAVKQIVEYYLGEKAPDVACYSYMRKSVFTAYSLVALYREYVEKALKGIDLEVINGLDYCELIK